MARISAWSLRRRLTVIAGCAMVASIAFGGVAMYWTATIENEQMLDASLEQLGATVLSFVEEDIAAGGFAGAANVTHLKTRPSASLLYRYQVWSSDGELLMRSHEAPADAPLVDLQRLGFSTAKVKGEEYRVFALPSKNREIVIQVAENIDEQWRGIGSVTAYYASFLLLPFTLVFGLSWLLMRRSFRSIEAMADQLRHRNPLNLAPIRVADPPTELLPILQSIDTLFGRVGHALSTERRFTSVAAHEMRTPLAGLRAQSQLASTARDEHERQEALSLVRVGVDRASYLLDQLLDLARIEALPAEGTVAIERVRFVDVCRDVMTDLAPRAEAKGVTVDVQAPADTLPAHRFALSVLLRNLLANAIAHSPAGGRVEVKLAARADAIELTVDDAGPGIAPAHRERAFERFERLGQTRAQGVGLGLSIVLSVVELHRAQIRLLDSPLGGLRVLVIFARDASEDAAARGVPTTPA